MRVLVTGSSGLVGSYVVQALRAGGHAVLPLDRAEGGDVSLPAMGMTTPTAFVGHAQRACLPAC